jgi:hypothetical protein
MACSCGSGSSGGVEAWVNVKADGTPTKAMSKAEAVASQSRNGGYLRKA